MTNDKTKLERYCRQNPNSLTPGQLAKICEEMDHPRDKTISDEYLDFKLWCSGLPSRQESFANYIEEHIPVAAAGHILEVGGGVSGRLSLLLAKKGYHMTCMDPELELGMSGKAGDPGDPGESGDCAGIEARKELFDCRTADISGYDYVVAQEPCEAAEHIVRACSRQRVPFMVLLCGVPHRLISGEMPEDVWEWYQYLSEIDPDDTEMAVVDFYGPVKTVMIKSKYK